MGEASIKSSAVRALVTLTLVAAVVLVGGAWVAAPQQPELSAVAPVPAPQPDPPVRDGGTEDPAPAVDPDAPAVWPDVHVIAAGETLGEIADRYGVPLGELVHANAVPDPSRVRPGDVLMLPHPDHPVPRSPRTAEAEAPALARLLEDTARTFGWRPETVKAVAWAESRWNHARVSHRGAVGVMQVKPETVDAMAEHLGRDLDPYDLEDNVVAGVAYLDWLHAQYGGDAGRVFAAYVQGPTSVAEIGRVSAAERYVAEVLRWRDVFAGG